MPPRLTRVFLVALGACAQAPNAPPKATPPAAPAEPLRLLAKSTPLPGATGPVTVDYLSCCHLHARVYVPVGETGSADVFDVATGAFTRIDGFKTMEREAHGKKRTMGPSAATVGDGFVYVGNRATGEVCAIDERTLKLGDCLKVPTATDGVAYVASAREVWVTTPRDHSLTVLDASKPDVLRQKLVIKTDGDPEGFAVDSVRGVFYTNLEDKNRTIAVDLKTHAVKATFSPGCGPDGPRGIAVDEARNFVMVACTDGVRVLDVARDGALIGELDTGAGVDNIEFLDITKLLIVAAGKASRLTVARLSDTGQPAIVATGDTAEGARNAVADGDGNIYVVDPRSARLLAFTLAMPR